VKFNPLAFAVFAAFAALIGAATSFRSTSAHLAEAICTVIIAVGVGSLAFYRSDRSR
jgi:hypothetical protein